MTSLDPFAQDDAAYVLGALDDDDRVAFEEHLHTCPDCRARVEELRPTVALMAAVRSPGFDLDLDLDVDGGPLPGTVLPRLLKAAARERTRRRRLTATLAGLAAACVIALVVVIWPVGSSTPSPAARAMTPVVASPVHATAKLVERRWGTQIDLHCYYDEGVDVSMPYDLVVIDTANKPHGAGSWWLTPDGSTNFTGGTEVRRDRIARVQVTLPDGTPILQLAI